MINIIGVVIFISFLIYGIVSKSNRSCGINDSPLPIIYGEADVSRFPWMGMLYYPIGNVKTGPTVVLVTAQICLTSAYELDRLPKNDLRDRARVALGQPCEKNEIKIRDYSYHPEYKDNKYSALALVQLDTDHITQELRPICPPPEVYLSEANFYALTMNAGCDEAKVQIYKMKYVNMEECQHFYRTTGLDVSSMWPTQAVCARSIYNEEECLWRSGTVLTVKQNGRWRLLGISAFGPGCGAPTRFLDYGKYHTWVRRSRNNIGIPSITRLSDNRVIMRRTLSNIQRFGPCDPGETKNILYTERQKFAGGIYTVSFNLSMYANVEYSCIVFNADSYIDNDRFPYNKMTQGYADMRVLQQPKIRVRRWCAGPQHLCYGFQYLDIHFEVVIKYLTILFLNVTVYGREAMIISPTRAMQYHNKMAPGLHPVVNTSTQVQHSFRVHCHKSPWHYAFLGYDKYEGKGYWGCPGR